MEQINDFIENISAEDFAKIMRHMIITNYDFIKTTHLYLIDPNVVIVNTEKEIITCKGTLSVDAQPIEVFCPVLQKYFTNELGEATLVSSANNLQTLDMLKGTR